MLRQQKSIIWLGPTNQLLRGVCFSIEKKEGRVSSMVSFSEASGQALVFSEAPGQVLIIFRGICSSVGHFQSHLVKHWSFSQAPGQALVTFRDVWSSTGQSLTSLQTGWGQGKGNLHLQITGMNKAGARESLDPAASTQLTGHELGGESTLAKLVPLFSSFGHVQVAGKLHNRNAQTVNTKMPKLSAKKCPGCQHQNAQCQQSCQQSQYN